MSIIAGIHYLDPNAAVPDEHAAELRRLISRDPARTIDEFSENGSLIFSLDLRGFHGDAAVRGDAGGFSVIAGETLGAGRLKRPDRGMDLAEIHNDIANGRIDLLKHCRGTFCIASVQDGSLTLIADKIGIRQMFYWIGPDRIVFSTALRILEELSFVPRRLNVRGAVEHAALGYPLADRTPYENIFAMRAGEILQFRPGRTLRCRYWKWDEMPVAEVPEDELLDQLFKAFTDSVRFRLQGEATAVAYLSGGLDSRCVVAALCGLQTKTHTFNFARPHTQDLVLGARFASKVDVIHTEIPKDAGDHVPDYSAKIADAWRRSPNRERFPVSRDGVVWSGEGGSVALGHVHLGRRIVELMRLGRIDDAIDTFFEREGIHLSPKIFNSKAIDRPLEIVKQGIREEIAQFSSCDAARNFYLFLMLNDQRRKLHSHFENIDLHGIEFQLPFFDGEFLRTILEIPVDLCLEHRLYVNWLYKFQPAVTDVPWQAYPGHAPCPLPVDDHLAYQWGADYQDGEQKALNGSLRREAKALLKSRDFPSKLLSRSNLRIAYLIHRTRLRDYSYLIDTARLLERFNRNCR